MKWIEILSTNEAALNQMGQEFKVHPLALEDCHHRDQQPKLDDYETHQLLVWFMFSQGKLYEFQFLIFSDTLIAIPHEPPPTGASWKEHLNLNDLYKDVWHLLYHALDKLTDITWREMRLMYTQVDDFEQAMFKVDINPKALLRLKKKLNHIDYSIGHLSSVAKQLQNLCRPKDDLVWKLRDLYDHCDRIYRSINLFRTQIDTTIELFWGLQANRTNKQIKKLSLLASIAVPLTFWASFWGMNFQAIPFASPVLFYTAIAIMMVSVTITLWLLVKKGYWND